MRKIITLFLLFTMGISFSFPAESTSSFDVLTIGTGGAASSLGNAQAAEIDSIEGAFYNPATLGSLSANTSIILSYNPYSSMSIATGIIAARLGSFTFAASGFGLIFDPIIGYVEYNGDPGRVLAAGNYVFGASASCSFGSMLRLPFILDIGVNARYAREILDTESLSAVLGDAGVIFGFRNIIGEDTLSFGMYGRNIGIPISSTTAITLPTSFTVGFSYRTEPRKYLLGIKLIFDASYYFNDMMRYNLGAGITLFKIASLRLGYMFGYDARGFTAGAGARIPIGDMSFAFDYAIIPMGDLGMHHSLQLGVAFGTFAADPARDVYEKGEALLGEKRYREALGLYSSVPPSSVLYETSRSKMAVVNTLLYSKEQFEAGADLFNSEKYSESIAAWQNVASASEYYTRARDGISRAQTRINEYKAEVDIPASAVKSYDDVYVEAVTYAKGKNYNKAIELWKTIPEDAELYARAQKSIEKAYARIKEMESVILQPGK